jgi:uncharacterized repeat protein (TIGR02543 family)
VNRAVRGPITAAVSLSVFGAMLMPVAAAAAPQVASYPSVAALAAAFASADTGPVIALTEDLTGTQQDPVVEVRAGASITLDLHGHTLKLDSQGPALGVLGGTSLTIVDSVGGGELIANSVGDDAAIGGLGTDDDPTHDPGYGTIVISGAVVTATAASGAAIGGGRMGNDGGGTVLITDGSVVTATSAYAAGIGGSYYSGSSGTITIDGASTVVATGGAAGTNVGGAGIGGGPNGFADAITISEGSNVTATGGSGGAGVGGGNFAEAITISGSTVRATGMGGAAGIGGGYSGLGSNPLRINGGSVTAIGGEGAAGIGAGAGAGGYNSGSLTIDPGSEVTASSASGIAFGTGIGSGAGSTFGSLTNNGRFTIPAGNGITIPAGSVVSNGGTVVVDGTITNNGTIVNTGTIQNPSNVTVHNTAINLDGNGGTPPTDAVGPVFATSFHDGQVPFPAAAMRTGYTFAGWFTSVAGGTQVNETTYLGAGGPKTFTLYARWSANLYTVSFNSQGGSNVAPESVNYGDPATPPAPPVRAGYTFLGWYADASGGDQWEFTTPITADLTLYAQWSPSLPGATPGPGDGDPSPGTPVPGTGSNSPGAGASRTGLAATGADVTGLSVLACLIAAAGIGLVAVSRRRRPAER